MINKKTIEAQKFCSKDKTKEQLKGVYIKDNIAIATDSFKLVKITKKDLPKVVIQEGIYNLEKYTEEIDISKNCKDVKLEFNQDKKPLKFTSEDDTQKIEVLLMPLLN